jgi:hypothetical protein
MGNRGKYTRTLIPDSMPSNRSGRQKIVALLLATIWELVAAVTLFLLGKSGWMWTNQRLTLLQ